MVNRETRKRSQFSVAEQESFHPLETVSKTNSGVVINNADSETRETGNKSLLHHFLDKKNLRIFLSWTICVIHLHPSGCFVSVLWGFNEMMHRSYLYSAWNIINIQCILAVITVEMKMNLIPVILIQDRKEAKKLDMWVWINMRIQIRGLKCMLVILTIFR